MHNKIIADAGSTKVDWIVMTRKGEITSRVTTEGINALLLPEEEAEESFAEVRNRISGHAGDNPDIHYYGAGCATPEICLKIEEALRRVWNPTEVSVSSDLLGAARALFGDRSGIACILGTGSNSCLYDGREIASHVPSLGYILGDEGSGAALGKRLVADVFKGVMDEGVRKTFIDWSGLTLSEILDKTYRSKAPNRFLASLVPFLKENLWNPHVYSLVLEELTDFFRRNVAMYKGAHSLPVSFIGSVAAQFENILREAASSQGYSVSEIHVSPIEGLAGYHKEKTEAERPGPATGGY